METIASTDGGNGAATGATESQAAPVNSWHSGFDQDTVGWLDNRGLTKLDEKSALPELVKGFRNAEKYIGTPAEKLLRLPDWDKADKVELDQFYGKLGRPADASGYEINVPEGMDASFSEIAKAKFHELGLTAKQGKALADWNNQYGSEMAIKQQESMQQATKDQEAALRHDWGNAYDKQLSIAKNAATSIGLTPEKVDALQSALGYDGVMKLMADIGGKIGEAGFVGGDSGNNFNGVLTPNQAVARLANLQSDKEWVGKYMAGNMEAKAEMTRLMKMAYPD